MAKKPISIEALASALTNQRSYMLAMANTDLTPYQANVLNLIFSQNQELVNVLGIQVPELDEQLVKYFNEVAFLENLYRSSPNEKSSTEAGTNKETQ